MTFITTILPCRSVGTSAERSSGGNLRLVRKGRVIMYLTPQLGGFLVELVLAEKAVNAAQALDLPGHVLKLIDDAPRYSEGRGFRVPVKSLEDVAAVELLAAAKMAG